MKHKRPDPEPAAISGGVGFETASRFFAFRLGAAFGQPVSKLPLPERRLVDTLRRYFSFSHNGFALLEALDICTRNKVNSPSWVLIALNDGMQRALGGRVSVERALRIGRNDKTEYDQFREQQPIMAELFKKIEAAPLHQITPACRELAASLDCEAPALEKQYRRFWKPFFESLFESRGAHSDTF